MGRTLAAGACGTWPSRAPALAASDSTRARSSSAWTTGAGPLSACSRRVSASENRRASAAGISSAAIASRSTVRRTLAAEQLTGEPMLRELDQGRTEIERRAAAA